MQTVSRCVLTFNDVLSNRSDVSLTSVQPKMIPKDTRFRIMIVMLASYLSFMTAGCSRKAEANRTAAASDPEVVELTKQVRRYSFEKRRLPQNLDELVTAGYIKSVPPAPAGKKYAVAADKAEVILVNQ
jgi:competence protein ComGC